MDREFLEKNFHKMRETFDNSYDLLACYHLNKEEQILLTDNDNPKKCRFCGLSEPEVSFKKVAHTISHMVENRHLKSDYECDSCNQLFSTYESDFAAYMNLFHTFFEVHGKRGVPKFKNNSASESKISIENNIIKINVKEDNEPIIEWDEEAKDKNTIKLVGYRTFVPQNVLKALTKMALSIIPKAELPNLSDTIKWLLNQNVNGIIHKILLRIFPIPLEFTSCYIFKKKGNITEIVPTYIFILAYKNIVFQVPLPFINMETEHKDKCFLLSIFPAPLDLECEPIICQQINLASREKTNGGGAEIGLKYDHAEKIPLTTKSNSDEKV